MAGGEARHYFGALNPFDRELIADEIYWPEGVREVNHAHTRGDAVT